MSNWISVKDRLPEDDGEVIVFAPHPRSWSRGDGNAVWTSVYLKGGCWTYIAGGFSGPLNPTHWQPLPEPPKDGE